MPRCQALGEGKSHGHELSQLFSDAGLPRRNEDGLPVRVNASPPRPSRHLPVPSCIQRVLRCVPAHVVLPVPKNQY